jgi:Spy/CpxP family protein refolding chaperone
MRRSVGGSQTLRRIGLTFLAAVAFVAAGALCDSQTGVAVAADQPAAAGSAEPAGSGQTGKTQATPSTAKKSTGKKAKGEKSAKPRGRLPAYFSDVVTEEQRDKIYAIQKECEPRINELKRDLEALTKARDEKINALLTPEQKSKIEDRKAEAKKDREKKEGTESKEGNAKPTPPAPKPQSAKAKPKSAE